MSRRLFMLRKPLDIKLTDYPFGKKEVPNFLPCLPCLPNEGRVWAEPTNNKPRLKAGANVSIILGHFQKCLTQGRGGWQGCFMNYFLSSPNLCKLNITSPIFFLLI